MNHFVYSVFSTIKMIIGRISREPIKVTKVEPTVDSIPFKKVEPNVIPVLQTEIIDGKLNPLFFTPNNIVLLIDISGSMAKPDRLDLFIKQSHELIEKLRPVDRVSIIVFSQTARMMVPPTPAIEKNYSIKPLIA